MQIKVVTCCYYQLCTWLFQSSPFHPLKKEQAKLPNFCQSLPKENSGRGSPRLFRSKQVNTTHQSRWPKSRLWVSFPRAGTTTTTIRTLVPSIGFPEMDKLLLCGHVWLTSNMNLIKVILFTQLVHDKCTFSCLGWQEDKRRSSSDLVPSPSWSSVAAYNKSTIGTYTLDD